MPLPPRPLDYATPVRPEPSDPHLAFVNLAGSLVSLCALLSAASTLLLIADILGLLGPSAFIDPVPVVSLLFGLLLPLLLSSFLAFFRPVRLRNRLRLNLVRGFAVAQVALLFLLHR